MTKSRISPPRRSLLSILAGTAMAQEVIYNPGYCAQLPKRQLPEQRAPGNPYIGSYQRQTYRDQAYRDYRDRSWHNSYNRWDDDNSIWPGDVAAGVVGGAVGTAAAIAT